MNARASRLRVLVLRDPGFGVSGDDDSSEVAAILSEDPALKVSESTAGYGEATRAVHKSEAELVVIDEVAGDPATIVEQIEQAAPDVPVVVLLSEDQATSAQPCIVAGARAFLFRPYEPADLIDLVKRIQAKEERRRRVVAPPTAGRTGRVIVVHGPKGGVGTTTVAVNLAVAMHQQTGLRVALVDGSLMAGDVAVAMNIASDNSIADVVAHLRELDADLLDGTLVHHTSGIWVLPSPAEFERAEAISGDETSTILTACRAHYDVVVVDSPSRPDEHLLAALDVADAVLMICTPEIASLKNTARFLALGHELGYSDDKLKLVINRLSSHGAIPLDDIEANLRHKMSFGLPSDGIPVVEALNAGEPVVVMRPSARIARELGRLSAQLARELGLPGQEPLPAQGRTRTGISLFGRLRGPKMAAAR